MRDDRIPRSHVLSLISASRFTVMSSSWTSSVSAFISIFVSTCEVFLALLLLFIFSNESFYGSDYG